VYDPGMVHSTTVDKLADAYVRFLAGLRI
jgi:hypothetical protein